MTSPTIIIQCSAEQTTHIKLTMHEAGLLIQFGDSGTGGTFAARRYLMLPFLKYPRLRKLHDGAGWHLGGLFSVLADIRGGSLPRPIAHEVEVAE